MTINSKRVLLIGGTGSMGSYLIPELLRLGCKVDAVTQEPAESKHPALRYLTTDAKNLENLKQLLKNDYDGIIDFLYYNKEEYALRLPLIPAHAKHYIFLSSYRVYADFDPIANESSPRHADAASDLLFRNSADYSITKAKCEDLLRNSGFDNWTIVRPSIIFSRMSFPLVSLGACSIVNRAREGKPTLIPDSATEIQGTVTWSGDAAKMFAGILFNPDTFTETYTLATAEHHSWGAMAKYYKELIGLKTLTIDLDSYKSVYCQNEQWGVWQIDYDRMLNRVMDNSKILKAAKLTQSDLCPVRKALEMELSALPPKYRFPDRTNVNERIDRFLDNGGKIVKAL